MTANGFVTVSLPAVFDVAFDAPQTVEGFSIFNKVGSWGTDGVENFSVSLFDEADNLLWSLAGTAQNLGNVWQDWSFAEIENVSSAQFTILSSLSGGVTAEVSEIRFTTPDVVPEPSAGVLLPGALGMLLVLRRRG